ncbi:MAG: DHH family phosphoesterase [Candidatus Aenigmatarchaeota archaeon]
MVKAVGFLKGIKQDDNVIIIFHNDTDGICSTVLLMKLLKTVDNEPTIIPQPMPVNETLAQKVKTYMANKIIFVDLAVDQQPNVLKELQIFCDILIIDHHVPNNSMNGKRIIHFNPRFDDKNIYQSASYITYNLCNKIIDMRKWLWLAGVGMVGDYNLEDSGDLVKQIEEAYPAIKQTGINNSILANIGSMITATKATKLLSLEEIVSMINSMQKPDDIQKSQKGDNMLRSFELVQNEMAAVVADVEIKFAKNKYILYELGTKYNLRSPVATAVSEKHPDKFVAIYQEMGKKIKMSVRHQNGDDVITILEKAAKGTRALVGGHMQAAGATIDKREWEKFKAQLKAVLE